MHTVHTLACSDTILEELDPYAEHRYGGTIITTNQRKLTKETQRATASTNAENNEDEHRQTNKGQQRKH